MLSTLLLFMCKVDVGEFPLHFYLIYPISFITKWISQNKILKRYEVAFTCKPIT